METPGPSTRLREPWSQAEVDADSTFLWANLEDGLAPRQHAHNLRGRPSPGPECASRAAPYAALVMAPPAWLSTITGVSTQLISGSEP
jgi:hypothetical protein